MEIFSHALWSAGLVQLANRHLRVKHKHLRLKPILTAGWGIFPDMVVFAPVWAVYVWNLISGKIDYSQIPQHGQLGLVDTNTVARVFYSLSHSLVVFCVVMLFVVLLYRLFTGRRAQRSASLWAMLGWGFHILIDVPSHSYDYSATPVLWPISEWRFSQGIDWGAPTFLLFNFLALFLLYLFLWRTEPRKKRVKWDNPLA